MVVSVNWMLLIFGGEIQIAVHCQCGGIAEYKRRIIPALKFQGGDLLDEGSFKRVHCF